MTFFFADFILENKCIRNNNAENNEIMLDFSKSNCFPNAWRTSFHSNHYFLPCFFQDDFARSFTM